MINERDVLLKAVELQYELVNDSILEEISYLELARGLSSINTEREREQFVNELRTKLSKRLDELLVLKELLVKLEYNVPVEV